MKSKIKSRMKIILSAIGVALMLPLPLLLSGCGKKPEAVKQVPPPTSTPFVVNLDFTGGPQDALKPTPSPPEMTTKEIYARVQELIEENKRLRATPTAAPIPIPDIPNPFLTDQERAEQRQKEIDAAARKGFVVTDEQGNSWARISRDDGKEVTGGLPAEQTTISTGENIEPITSRDAEGWKVRFMKKEAPTATPAASATITPTVAPTPSFTPVQVPMQPPGY
jgi:hypothetical protein